MVRGLWVLSAAAVCAVMTGVCRAETEDYLLNPSFTNGDANVIPTGWEKYIGSDDFECIRDESVSHTAPASMKVAGYTDKSGGGAHFQLRRIPKGVPVTVSAWVKFERYSGRGQFAVEAANFNPKYNQLLWVDIVNSSASTGWQQVSATVVIPVEATTVWLTAFLKSNTRIWIDDIQIQTPDDAATSITARRAVPAVGLHHAGAGLTLRVDGRAVTGGAGRAVSYGVYVADRRKVVVRARGRLVTGDE